MIKYNNKMMINSLELPELSCFDDLVRETRLSSNLIYWLSKEDATGRYKTFYIEKNNGEKREINAPVNSLRLLQRWVLEEILYKVKPSKYAYGFKKDEHHGSPLLKCSQKHKNKKYLLKMDLKDFYPSISRKQVFCLFVKIGYSFNVANLLTNICVLNNTLPQGAVTSPFLSNLICLKMDARIAGYCNKRNIVYTRYADDLAFSSDDRDLLRNIFGMIKLIVEDEKFVLNEAKTIFMTPKAHKRLLGTTINDNSVKAPKEMKKKVRAMIHYSMVTGEYGEIDVLRGYIAYINSIEKGYKDKCIDYILRLSNKPSISMFDKAVDSYNANKIFKELPDMIKKTPGELVKYYEIDDFVSDMLNERRDFFVRHNLSETMI